MKNIIIGFLFLLLGACMFTMGFGVVTLCIKYPITLFIALIVLVCYIIGGEIKKYNEI